MILLDIKKMIRNRVKELESDYVRDRGYELCKDFSDSFYLGKVEDFMNIDIYECVKCLYYINNTSGKTVEECCDLIDSLKDYIDDLSADDYSSLFDMVFVLNRSSERENVISYLEESNALSAKVKLNRIDFDELISYTHNDMGRGQKLYHMMKIVKGLKKLQNKCNILGLLIALKDDDEVLGNALSLIEVQKKMLEDRTKLEISMDVLSYSSREKERSKIISSFYKEFYKPKAIIGVVNSIKSFVIGIEKKEIKYYKDAKREIAGYESSIKLLEEALERDEITNARNIVRGVKSEDIKKAILQLIYEHNLRYYDSLEEQFEKLSSSSIGEYISALSKYDIKMVVDDVKKLMFNPIEEFKEILAILSKINITNNSIIRLMKFTNVNVCRVIKEYFDKGFITSELINNNFDLFNEDCSSYKNLCNNIGLLNSYNINPSIFNEDCSVLLTDSILFDNNLNLLESYGLLKSIRTTKNFHFISDLHLAEKIDKLIELGYFNFLEQDLDLLNSDNLRRLEVLKVMHFELDNLSDIKDVLETSKFIINDSMINEYIPDILPYKDKVSLDLDINDLEGYRKDKYSYLIGGVLISSNKVKRLLDEGVDMYDAIFSGVLIGDEEYREMLFSLCPQK